MWQIFWLFVIWTPLVYYSTAFIKIVADGELTPFSIVQPLFMFLVPPLTMWFLYALGVVYFLARVTRDFDKKLMLGILIVAYVITRAEVIPEPEHFERLFGMVRQIALLAPFFFIASYLSVPLRQLIETKAGWGLIGLGVYFVLALFITKDDFFAEPMVTFAASGLGIVSLMMILQRYSESPIVDGIAAFGQRSLFVFVLHRIPLFYFKMALENTAYDASTTVRVMGAIVIVAGCWALGEFVLSRYAKWTMTAPSWFEGRMKQITA